MAILKIRTYGDPILRQKASRVDSINGDIAKLADDMMETMHRYDGIGLAANQVGVLKRIITLDLTPNEPSIEPMVLINPVIIESQGEISYEEGCLSIPDITADVIRPSHVLVRAMTLDDKNIEIEADGLLARALQHEIDHLDGIMFVDRLSFIKRQILRNQLKKMEEETKQSVT